MSKYTSIVDFLILFNGDYKYEHEYTTYIYKDGAYVPKMSNVDINTIYVFTKNDVGETKIVDIFDDRCEIKMTHGHDTLWLHAADIKCFNLTLKHLIENIDDVYESDIMNDVFLNNLIELYVLKKYDPEVLSSIGKILYQKYDNIVIDNVVINMLAENIWRIRSNTKLSKHAITSNIDDTMFNKIIEHKDDILAAHNIIINAFISNFDDVVEHIDFIRKMYTHIAIIMSKILGVNLKYIQNKYDILKEYGLDNNMLSKYYKLSDDIIKNFLI